MRSGVLGWGILIVLSISVLSIITADKNTTETGNWNSDASEPESRSTWLRLGRNLANLGLGSLDTSTGAGVLSDLKIGLLDGLSNSDLNPFFIFDRFLNQTRSTIPIIANHGNFTLLQAALLCAVGALAAGAGAIALEAFYFKTVNDQTLAYNAQQAYHAESAIYGAPAYGAPVKPAYGAPVKPAYGVPAYNNRRSFNVPVQQLRFPPPPLPTLSAKRLKPQSLRRTQRRNQRKNQASSGRNPNSNAKSVRKRRKRQANNYLTYSAATPLPLSWAQYLSSYLYSPFQSTQQRQSYASNLNSYSYNSPNYGDVSKQSPAPARSDSQSGQSQSWFNFQTPNLNRKRNMINRSFQRYT